MSDNETPVNKSKEYYAKNRDKLNQRNKEYRANNYQKVKDAYKQYWLDNKDKIKERRKERLECPVCGSSVTRESFSRHVKSKIHISKIPVEETKELKSNEDI